MSGTDRTVRGRHPWLCVALLAACGGKSATAPAPTPAPAAVHPPSAAPPAASALQIPVEYHKLANGLRVVLSPDPASPTVAVAVYYHIGFRLEPKGRTGFAHLFEHMMFQGSRTVTKAERAPLMDRAGAAANGSTRFDFTNYYEVVPTGALDLMLWMEADRMAGLDLSQENLTNQKGVVSSEVRVNVLNRPYGGFPWLDMPQLANTRWSNAHNFYGDLAEIEAATLTDVKAFFDTYYAPGNAALVLVGGFDPTEALAMIEKHFAPIPARPQPAPPELTEPRQTEEKRREKIDPLATRPALAFSYHMPPRGTPEHLAMGLIKHVLSEGRDSLLHDSLVLQHGYTAEVETAINELGNPYNYQGPMLYTTWLFHDAGKSADEILAAVDAEVKRLQDHPLDPAALARAKVKLRAELYDVLEQFNGFGKADLLASFALFDDDPARINQIEPALMALTPELVQRTAREVLRRENRTVLVVRPKGGAK
ncbi:MAG TPA: pitrilysin family protein [Kofleriaceae bacterium]|nr:pitrilysin family protein [Kofleriaceae bacterium]